MGGVGRKGVLLVASTDAIAAVLVAMRTLRLLRRGVLSSAAALDGDRAREIIRLLRRYDRGCESEIGEYVPPQRRPSSRHLRLVSFVRCGGIEVAGRGIGAMMSTRACSSSRYKTKRVRSDGQVCCGVGRHEANESCSVQS